MIDEATAVQEAPVRADVYVPPENTTAKVEQQAAVRNDVLTFLSSRSGFSQDEVAAGLGDWISGQLGMQPAEVIDKHFVAGDQAALNLLANYKRLKERNIPDAEAVFWRELLEKRYQTDPAFRDYIETVSKGKFKEILSSDATASVERHLKTYDSGDPVDFGGSLEADKKQLILRDAGSPEAAAANIEKVDAGLEAALEIGQKIRAEGYVPVYRFLFFADPAKKAAVMEQYQGGADFQAQYAETPIEGLTLQDIAAHSEAKAQNSPLDSWTFVPPNSKWRFGQGKLGRVPALVMISKVKKEDTLAVRRYGSSFGSKEEYTFFDTTDQAKESVSDTTALTELQAAGKKGVFLPNEGEITLWGTHTNEGLIDLGP